MRSPLPALCATVWLTASGLVAADIVPVDPGAWSVPAGEPSVLHVRTTPGGTVRWRLADWDGRAEAQGSATADARGLAELVVTPTPGWHELACEEGGQFGLIALAPELDAVPDPFFALDAGLAWHAPDTARRVALISQLRRLGIAEVRERFGWGSLETKSGQPVLPTRTNDDALYALYAQQRISVLGMFHDTPAWLGRAAGPFPADLPATAASWGRQASRFSPALTSIEAWNEPDAADYSGDGTPDHLVALTRAVAWGARQTAPGVLVTGGAFTNHASKEYRELCWANGLLGASDVFSYHDYHSPELFEPWLTTVRAEMAAAGDPSIPVWITESGKAWPKGEGRPNQADADKLSAQWIAVRAAEARACGVDRYYAFFYPFYEEGRSNFGMTGRDGTALRSLAAFSQCARRLAGLDYAGDLAIPGARRVRAFTGGDRTVAVAWLGAPGAGASLATDLPVRSVHGLDGRPLAKGADGAWLVSEGACFIELEPAARGRIVESPTLALWRTAHLPRARREVQPVTLQLMGVPGEVSPRQMFYSITPKADGSPTVLRVRVSHLASGPRAVQVRLEAPAGATVLDAAEQTVQVAGPGWSEATWRVTPSAHGRWTIRGTVDGAALPPVVADLVREPDGPAILAGLAAQDRRTITPEELQGVDNNIMTGDTMTKTVLPDGGWRMQFQTNHGGFWGYPRLTLPQDARFDRFNAVLVRMRCSEPAAVRMLAFEKGGPNNNIGYLTETPIIAADGAWHWALIRLGELVKIKGIDEDLNGRLDPADIDRISIGINQRSGRTNTLEISRLELVRLPPAAP